MKISQLSTFIENRSGRLRAACEPSPPAASTSTPCASPTAGISASCG
jgi:hypothetical protein